MVKNILGVMLGGLLVFGVSTAFAEESQLSDQEVLKAWGVQKVVEPEASVTLATELKPGLTPLSDEGLEDITGAGFGIPELPLALTLPLQPPTDKLPSLPEKPTKPEIPVGTDIFGKFGQVPTAF